MAAANALAEFVPVTLEGNRVTLLPLAADHLSGLADAARDGELWRIPYTAVPSLEGMSAEIQRRLSLLAAGSMIPFTIAERATGRIIGMTTYLNIDRTTRRVEIGYTWYAQRVQRSALNTEAKLLLLRHAFEVLDCMGVEFRTHHMNHQSRRAIERLGAKLDGILRSHVLMLNGTWRDTCVYSVLATEWPTVEAHLRWQLVKRRQTASP